MGTRAQKKLHGGLRCAAQRKPKSARANVPTSSSKRRWSSLSLRWVFSTTLEMIQKVRSMTPAVQTRKHANSRPRHNTPRQQPQQQIINTPQRYGLDGLDFYNFFFNGAQRTCRAPQPDKKHSKYSTSTILSLASFDSTFSNPNQLIMPMAMVETPHQ